MVSTTAAPAAAPPQRGLLVNMAALMLIMFLAVIDQTVVATALPVIATDLHGFDQVAWLVTAFSLTSGISGPLYGKLSDMFGRKRLYLFSIALFLAGSALCGLAGSMGQLIAFRAVQGAGAGGLMVLTMAIAADLTTPKERAKFQGVFGALFGIGAIAGPVIGGFLTDHLSWRWIFAINLPLGVLALVAGAVTLKLPRRTSPHRIDWAGFALISGVLTCLTLLASWGGVEYAWSSPVILGLGAGAAVLMGLFVWAERRAEEPLLPLRLFRDATFTLGSAGMILLATGMLGAVTFLPMFLQLVTGASASNSGLLLMPVMLGMVVSSFVTGQLVTRFGRYKWISVGGAALITVTAGLFATMGASTSPFLSGVYMVLFGIGLGMCTQNLTLAMQTSAPAADRGVVTSAAGLGKNVGGAVGVSILGAALASHLSGGIASGLSTVFAWTVPILALGALVLAFLPDLRLSAH